MPQTEGHCLLLMIHLDPEMGILGIEPIDQNDCFGSGNPIWLLETRQLSWPWHWTPSLLSALFTSLIAGPTPFWWIVLAYATSVHSILRFWIETTICVATSFIHVGGTSLLSVGKWHVHGSRERTAPGQDSAHFRQGTVPLFILSQDWEQQDEFELLQALLVIFFGIEGKGSQETIWRCQYPVEHPKALKAPSKKWPFPGAGGAVVPQPVGLHTMPQLCLSSRSLRNTSQELRPYLLILSLVFSLLTKCTLISFYSPSRAEAFLLIPYLWF